MAGQRAASASAAFVAEASGSLRQMEREVGEHARYGLPQSESLAQKTRPPSIATGWARAIVGAAATSNVATKTSARGLTPCKASIRPVFARIGLYGDIP
jgi:hypothetical protein